MDEAPERREVARLNWMAGCKARAASAYGPARSHFETGLRLLDAGKWETDYELTRALHQELMLTGFLPADYALMDACGKELYAGAHRAPPHSGAGDADSREEPPDGLHGGRGDRTGGAEGAWRPRRHIPEISTSSAT